LRNEFRALDHVLAFHADNRDRYLCLARVTFSDAERRRRNRVLTNSHKSTATPRTIDSVHVASADPLRRRGVLVHGAAHVRLRDTDDRRHDDIRNSVTVVAWNYLSARRESVVHGFGMYDRGLVRSNFLVPRRNGFDQCMGLT